MLGKNEKLKIMKQYYGLGVSYYKAGQYKKAIRQWEKVLILAPKHKQSKTLIKKARKKMAEKEKE